MWERKTTGGLLCTGWTRPACSGSPWKRAIGAGGVSWGGGTRNSFKQIAEFIGNKLHLTASSCSPTQASRHFGFLSAFVAADNPASSAGTQ